MCNFVKHIKIAHFLNRHYFIILKINKQLNKHKKQVRDSQIYMYN